MWRSNLNGSESRACARSKAALMRGALWAIRSTRCIAILALACSAAGASLNPPPGETYRQPQVAVSGDTVAIAWGSGNAVLFARSGNGGRTFAPAVRVAEAGVISLGNHRGPRVAIAGRSIVISAIYGEKGRGADGDLLAWRSTDAGRTWSKAARINDRAAAAREGLHGMSASGSSVYAVWLDDRDGGKALYGASSNDGGATWSANHKIYSSPDGHICECCHPSVAVRDQGREIFVTFRNWLAGSRDLYMARSVDGGRTFTTAKLGEGTWPLNACPMDGGGLFVDAEGPLTVWRRDSTIFFARPGHRETEIGPGKNPTLAGHTAVWQSPEGLRMKSGVIDPAGAFPSGASDGTREILAWESNGHIEVREVSAHR